MITTIAGAIILKFDSNLRRIEKQITTEIMELLSTQNKRPTNCKSFELNARHYIPFAVDVVKCGMMSIWSKNMVNYVSAVEIKIVLFQTNLWPSSLHMSFKCDYDLFYNLYVKQKNVLCTFTTKFGKFGLLLSTKQMFNVLNTITIMPNFFDNKLNEVGILINSQLFAKYLLDMRLILFEKKTW